MTSIIKSKIFLIVWKIKNGFLFLYGYNNEIIDNYRPPMDKITIGKSEKAIELFENENKDISENVSIIYGGSINPLSIIDLIKCNSIDSALVEGASLKI